MYKNWYVTCDRTTLERFAPIWSIYFLQSLPWQHASTEVGNELVTMRNSCHVGSRLRGTVCIIAEPISMVDSKLQVVLNCLGDRSNSFCCKNITQQKAYIIFSCILWNIHHTEEGFNKHCAS
jgi:hypothetical protein